MEVPEIDVAELAVRHAEGAPVLDVREPDEYSDGHVPGAQHIPLSDVPDRLTDVPTTGTVYVVCAGGTRSRRAAEFLRGNGVDAVNVAGGTRAWIEAGEHVVTGAEPG